MTGKLGEARVLRNITQKELASCVGTSDRNIRAIESGEREPGVRTAIRIARALGTKTLEDFEKLFYQSDRPRQP